MPYVIISGSVLVALLIVRISLGMPGAMQMLESSFATTPGKRQVNADVFDWASYGEQSLFVLANGIGRSNKGQIAAVEAVHSIVRLFEIAGISENPAYFFNRAFNGANAAILRRIVDSTAGASVLGATIKDGQLYYALVGNCRIGVYRGSDLIPLSEGHTIDMLAKKAFRTKQVSRIDALTALQERKVYNYVGHDGFKDLELFDVPVVLKKKDVIVMMTDGVFDFLSAGELERILTTRKSCDSMARSIIEQIENANHAEQDNATVVLIRVNRV